MRFNPTVEEWMEWAEDNIHIAIRSFLKTYPDLLDPTKEQLEQSALNGAKIPDRRSWHLLSKYLFNIPSLENIDIISISSPFVGESVALKFESYIKDHYNSVSVIDILENINKESVRKKIVDKDIKDISELGYIIDYIIEHLKKNEMKKKWEENLILFIEIIPDAVAVLFWKEFLSKCTKKATDWYNKYPRVKERIVKALSKK